MSWPACRIAAEAAILPERVERVELITRVVAWPVELV